MSEGFLFLYEEDLIFSALPSHEELLPPETATLVRQRGGHRVMSAAKRRRMASPPARRERSDLLRRLGTGDSWCWPGGEGTPGHEAQDDRHEPLGMRRQSG